MFSSYVEHKVLVVSSALPYCVGGSGRPSCGFPVVPVVPHVHLPRLLSLFTGAKSSPTHRRTFKIKNVLSTSVGPYHMMTAR